MPHYGIGTTLRRERGTRTCTVQLIFEPETGELTTAEALDLQSELRDILRRWLNFREGLRTASRGDSQ